MQTLEQCRVDARIEAVCSKGCRQVRQDIAALEAGAELPETRDLTEEERNILLRELKQIMAVYGDACRLPPP
ncbi:hypothetical protein [Thiocapsa marina]|uniref:Uncharacterized protein n=1 Tax=Thiocapsa marina 5811 TaxID=768671 RepID=F9U9W9_9GAMM|nr:hypothetical protein [Thiocapsa marina]EGV18917.1 hypothetical protein ThimaDRAFT_1721 [Thiocapsa marina 5811]